MEVEGLLNGGYKQVGRGGGACGSVGVCLVALLHDWCTHR